MPPQTDRGEGTAPTARPEHGAYIVLFEMHIDLTFFRSPRRIMEVVGLAMIGVSIVLMMGGDSPGETDCYYTMEQFAQYRYCEREYILQAKSAGYGFSIITALSLIVGMLLIVTARYGGRVLSYVADMMNEREQ